MISITGVMFLFGLTWLFAILTFSVPGLREVFQILFTIFNSFQGFFIFLFFCVFNKEALESWKELLSCGKYSSALLHPSHLKFSSSAATKKPKQTYTKSTGFGTSSGGKSTSEVSQTDYESSTITKGNIYEKSPQGHETVKEDLGTTTTTEQSKGTATSVEIEVTIESNEEMDEATQQLNVSSKQTKDEGQESIEAPDITAATLPIVTVQVEDADSHNNTESKDKIASPTEKEGKLGKKFASLKARIKRYSTRKMSKHHVEEVEIDFKSDSSQESGDEEVTATTL